MPHLMVHFEPLPTPLTLDDVIRELLQKVPNAAVAAADWYTSRRIEEKRIIDNVRGAGAAMPFGDEVLASVDRAAAASGPTKGISIGIGGRIALHGRISRDLMLLHSDGPIHDGTMKHLLAVFRDLRILKDFYVSE